MLGAGTVINPIIKIVTTVAILAAVYFFIVKPTLDTTEDITERSFQHSVETREDIQESVRESLREAQQIARQAGTQVEIPRSVKDSQARSQRLLDCVQRADQDVVKIQACNDRF